MTKKILITGENSYIGSKLVEWLEKENEDYIIIKNSVRNDNWKKIDFSIIDVIVHVAGIAHIKEKKSNIDIYYEVNRDLSFSIAEKAKESGVKQFIFLSSMSVYGEIDGEINLVTETKPVNHYGKSKLEAENLVKRLEDNSFRVAIIRPPMVYGGNCVGNYRRLSKIARKTMFFPQFTNRRSMIHVDNLSKFISLIIQYNDSGIFLPQNQELVCTSKMVRIIANQYDRDIKMVHFMNPFLKFLKKRISIINKVFGDLYYNVEVSQYKEDYNVWNFSKSIELTEDVESE